MKLNRIQDIAGYTFGVLRHVFEPGFLRERNYRSIGQQYHQGEIDRSTAKKKLLCAGFYPPSLANTYLTVIGTTRNVEQFVLELSEKTQ